MLSNSLKSTI